VGATEQPRSSLRAPTFPRADPLLLVGVAALHLALFLVVFPAAADDGGLRGFINLAYQDSGRTLAGSVPYRDFLLEYPPGLLVFMVAPRLFAASQLAYRAPFFVETAALDLVILLALHGSARAARLPVARALGLYTLALVLLGPIAAYRLDLAPAALVAAAVLAWQRDRPTLAAIALAAGAASKVYPLVFLPPLIADCWTRGRRREARRAAIAAILTLVALLGPALIAGTGALRHALRFQTGRHTEVEALWATPPLLLRVVLGDPLAVRNVDRAFVILGPGDALGRLGTPVLALATLFVYGRWWRLRAHPDRETRTDMLLTGTAALALAAAVLSKVLSPQYLLWAAPPLALLPARARGAAAALIAFYLALPLTQWLFPAHFAELVAFLTPRTVAVLALRNLLLAVSIVALLAAVGRVGRMGREDCRSGSDGPSPTTDYPRSARRGRARPSRVDTDRCRPRPARGHGRSRANGPIAGASGHGAAVARRGLSVGRP